MFGKKILTIVGAVLLFTTSQTHAALNKDFTTSGHILPGEELNSVGIYNDDTVVNMLGGLVDQMQTYDASIFNVAGGEVYSLYARESSSANIFGGSVRSVFTWDYATTNLYDGGSVFSLGAGGQSGVVNMAGGVTEYLRAGESGIINLYGGLVTNCLDAWDSATVNTYGYGFNYNHSAGSWDGGQLTGFWLDGTAFSIDLYAPSTYDHINLIPEPGSLALLSLGGLLLRRRRYFYDLVALQNVKVFNTKNL
jgi:hypothetical protein